MTVDGRTAAAVINLHDEGTSAVHSMLSLVETGAAAEQIGIAVEYIAVLDRADEVTREVAKSTMPAGSKMLVADFGDLGRARNAATQASSSEFVAFLDGDDLWGRNWLSSAVSMAAAEATDCIYHAEYNCVFGDEPHISKNIASDNPLFKSSHLRLFNVWTALVMAPRRVFEQIPYPPNLLERGFGFEDWSWNQETVARGVPHKVVADSVHFIRRRPGSLMEQSRNKLVTPYAQLSESVWGE